MALKINNAKRLGKCLLLIKSHGFCFVWVCIACVSLRECVHAYRNTLLCAFLASSWRFVFIPPPRNNSKKVCVCMKYPSPSSLSSSASAYTSKHNHLIVREKEKFFPFFRNYEDERTTHHNIVIIWTWIVFVPSTTRIIILIYNSSTLLAMKRPCLYFW